MKRAIGIVQARVGSKRLPGKVLLPINGMPSIYWVMRRAMRCERLDRVILATSTEPENDPLASLAESQGWACFRGPENDIVGRFLGVLDTEPADYVARINGDNFAVCPEVIAHGLDELERRSLDVCTPFIENSYPFGVGAEVGTSQTIERLAVDTQNGLAEWREHLFLYAYENRERYRVGLLEAPTGHCASHISVSVDESSEYQTLRDLFRAMEAQEETFGVSEIISFWNYDKTGVATTELNTLQEQEFHDIDR